MDDINMLFQIINSDENGYIDKKKLQRLCPHLSQIEIDTIFNNFNTDHDNRIYLKELLQSNDYQYKIEENMTQTQVNDICNVFSCQEQIYDFYETLRNGSGESVDQFQSILEVFACDVFKYRKEIKRLEDSYKREKDTNEKFLRDIEEEQQRDMCQLEEKVRQEERQKFDVERHLIQQRTSKEISELQSNLQRLRTIEQHYTTRKTDDDSSTVLLREEIAKLVEENQTLHASLNDSLTTNAILESDLQSFKSQLNERQTMLLQEKQSSSSNHRNTESLQTNVRHLVEVNKQLRDENDSLRAVIESNKSIINQPPSNELTTPKQFKSRPGSTLGSYWNYPKQESVSPSYVTTAFQRRFDSFDLGSADELGILANGIRPFETVDIKYQQNKVLPTITTSTLTNIANENNTTNDSGFSMTTVRDATENDSDPESKANKQIALKNVKQNRSLTNKKNNDDTDSDDVFVQLSLDHIQPKRGPPRRGLKKATNNAQSSKFSPSITRSPSMQRTDGSAMTDLQQDLSFDRMFKVVFCGDAAVGKSTLIMRICKGKFVSSVNSTLGVDFQNKQIEVDGKRVALQLWDTAGQERFRSIAKSYFRRCDGVILVYDATYERSFLNVREWINTIRDATPKKVSVMIVANKIDLRDQTREEGKRVIEENEGAKLAKEHEALFIETSAKDGTNSNETLIELARDMQCNEDLERFRTAGIDLDKKTKKKSACCGS